MSIYCREVNGNCFRLNVYDIAYMTSFNLAEENVLLGVSIADGEDVDLEFFEEILPANTKAQAKYRKDIFLKLRSKQLKLLHFSPSYGGEVTIICESVDFDNVLP